MTQKRCVDCGATLTGHGRAVRCHRCAAIFWRAPSKKPRLFCVDCGKMLNVNAAYKGEKVPTRCGHCAQVGKAPTFLGHRHGVETLAKMREVALARIANGATMPTTKGRRHTASELAKISGPNNHGWKGGISDARDKTERTEAYKLWRKSIFELDDFTCCFCGERGETFNAHHILPYADFPEYRTEINNGATLCVPCHADFHKELRAWSGKGD